MVICQGSAQNEQNELPLSQSFPDRGLFAHFKSYCLSDWFITTGLLRDHNCQWECSVLHILPLTCSRSTLSPWKELMHISSTPGFCGCSPMSIPLDYLTLVVSGVCIHRFHKTITNKIHCQHYLFLNTYLVFTLWKFIGFFSLVFIIFRMYLYIHFFSKHILSWFSLKKILKNFLNFVSN